MLQSRRSIFEKSRLYWSSKKGTWIAIDFEAWEYDHKVLTEFGYSLVRWEDGTEASETGHWIVKEHKQYINGTYVKGARDVRARCPGFRFNLLTPFAVLPLRQ